MALNFVSLLHPVIKEVQYWRRRERLAALPLGEERCGQEQTEGLDQSSGKN